MGQRGGSAVGVFPSTVPSTDGKTQCLLQNASPPSPVNAPTALAATYKTQYYLTVTSSYGNPTGQGWYDVGSTATFAVTSPVSGGAGTQYAFIGWVSSDAGGYAGADASHSLTVSSSITETASWKTQWQVAFAVNPSPGGTVAVNGQPSATAWYDDGAVINVQASINTGHVFSSWSGDIASITFANSTSPSTTATIHGTGTVTARFALADTTPPVIASTVTPSANSNGWNSGPVTVTWSVSDPESGIASSNGCATTTLNNETALGGTTLTCTVINGAGLSNSASVTVKIDLTAPTLKLPSPTVEAAGPSGATVTYDASASDSLSGVNTFSCTPASGSIFPLGNSTVSCSVKDKAGNALSGAFSVAVQDKTPPVVTVPADMTLDATGPSEAIANFTASAVDNVDGPLAPNCSPASGSTFALGSTTVTCSVTDKAGNTGSASFKVTVADRTPPTLTLPSNMTVQGTGSGGAAVTFSVSASDSIDGPVAVACSPASGSTFPFGTTNVSCSASDKAGNTATGSFTVTVENKTPPVLTLPGDISVNATGPAGAIVTFAASASSVVDGSVPVTCAPLSGSTFPLGTTTVSCSATDKAGNTATGTFTVTLQDKAPPVVTVPADMTVDATSKDGAVVTFTVSASDLVDGSVPVTCTPASGSTFSVGTTKVTCSATDKAGNAATGTFAVTVQDNTPPVVTVPADMTVNDTDPSGAVATFTVSASDAVDGAITPSCSPASGSTFAVGSTKVACSATDKAGNTGSASFNVLVQDKTPPVVTVPSDMTVGAAVPSGAVVTFNATALDNVDGVINPTCSPASGSTFAMGSTVVSCSATDKSGNTGSASFKVTVLDKAPPTLSLPSAMTVEGTSSNGEVVTYSASASDLVDGSVPVTCTPASGSTFPFGTTTVSCSAMDKAGNSASGNFTVTVQDKIPPVLTVPGDITVEATGPKGAAVTFTVSALDSVDGSVSVTCTPASGSTFALGSTKVTCSATDKAGNTGSASFNVNVVDVTPPAISVPSDMTANATGPNGAVVTFTASALDAVDGSVSVMCTPASGSTFPVGTTKVTCAATDKAGNAGSGSFNIIVQDKTAPVVTVPADMTVEASGPSGTAVTFTASASDLVDGSLTVTCTPPSGSTFAVGSTRVSCSASDKAGNSASASFNVIVQDKTPPVLTLPADMTVDDTDPGGAVATFTVSASDAVNGSVSVTCTPASGSTFSVGSTKVSCSATDKAGNTATGNFTVVVQDKTPPVVTVPADMNLDATGPAGAIANFTASAVDNVDGPLAPNCSPASGSTFALGSTTVTCSVTDKAGNIGSASFQVTVVDTAPPTLQLPSDMTVQGTGSSGAVVTFSVSASDLVDGPVPVTCTPASGSVFPFGTNRVSCSATDKAGNTATGTFTVTVQDKTPPVLTLPADMTVDATGSTGAVVAFTASALDAVDSSVSVACAPASGSIFPLGTTTVSCSATDKAGNSATGTFTVTVQDKAPPVLTVPADMTVDATGPNGAVVTYTASASDLVDGPLVTTCAPSSGSLFAFGSTTVTCSVTDKAGNTGSASFKVTVADMTAPTLTLPSDMTVQGTGSSGAVATFSVSASDLVDGSVPVSCAPASGSTFSFGTNTVSCSATDKAGNTGTGTFAVIVQDKTPPVVTVPTDMSVEATGPNGAVVTFTVSAMDAVDGSLTPACTPSSGSAFALGSTKVTCSVGDKAGNTASGSFTVTVVDRTSPKLTLPSDMTVQATSTSGAVVKFSASASDLVDGSVPVTCTPASGSTFPAGTTKVTCSATDKAGNSASGSFKVTVPAVTVKLLSSSGNGLSGGVVEYYSGGWKSFGTTGSDGTVSMALPPGTYVFQISYASGSQQMSQNVAKNPTVTFQTVRVHSDSGKCVGFIQVTLAPTRYTGASWQPFTQDMELLPGTYMFHFSDKTNDKSYALVVGAVKHIH